MEVDMNTEVRIVITTPDGRSMDGGFELRPDQVERMRATPVPNAVRSIAAEVAGELFGRLYPVG
jgi:hypothetical protein